MIRNSEEPPDFLDFCCNEGVDVYMITKIRNFQYPLLKVFRPLAKTTPTHFSKVFQRIHISMAKYWQRLKFWTSIQLFLSMATHPSLKRFSALLLEKGALTHGFHWIYAVLTRRAGTAASSSIASTADENAYCIRFLSGYRRVALFQFDLVFIFRR